MSKRGLNIYRRKDGRYEGRYADGYGENGNKKYRSIYGKTYTEVKDNGYVLGLRCPPYFTDSGAAYLVYADYKCFVGTEFTQDVKKVETPVADQLEVETGVNLTSTMFFEAND